MVITHSETTFVLHLDERAAGVLIDMLDEHACTETELGVLESLRAAYEASN